jgi:hypothetical protein
MFSEKLVQRFVRFLLAITIIGITILSVPTRVLAVPPLPSSFYGTIKLNDSNVPDGTLVQAIIKGKVVAYSQTQTYQGDSVYALDIPGDDPSTAAIEGGVDGDPITFTIGGIPAGQTGAWHSATNVNLDLTAVSSNSPEPPQATLAPPPTQTEISIQPPAVTTEEFTFPTVAPAANAGEQPAAQPSGSAAQPAAPTQQSSASPAQPTAPAPANPPAVAPTSGPANTTGSTQSTGAQSPAAAEPAGSSNRGSLAWIGLLLLLAVAGLAGFLYVRRK